MSPMGKCLMDKCFKQIFLTQTVLYNWIYPTSRPDRAHRHKVNSTHPSWVNVLKLMSVGPVGPRGGIYSSTEDVLCRVNFRKMIWRPNNCGYMQFCFCLWWDIFNYRLCYVQSLFSDGSSWPCYMLTKWEVEQLGTWPRTSWPQPWDIYP